MTRTSKKQLTLLEIENEKPVYIERTWTELKPYEYDDALSFYGKAKIWKTDTRDAETFILIENCSERLDSYKAGILRKDFEGGKWGAVRFSTMGNTWADLSRTSRRHLREYWLQKVCERFGYERLDGGNWYWREIDRELYVKHIIPRAYDMIAACNDADYMPEWPEVWRYMQHLVAQYFDNRGGYVPGGKCFKQYAQGLCDTIRAGVPLDDIIA